LKKQEQLPRELAKQRRQELVGRAECREDAIQEQREGDESPSKLYSDSMDENDADSRVCSAMCDKYLFLFLTNCQIIIDRGFRNASLPGLTASKGPRM